MRVCSPILDLIKSHFSSTTFNEKFFLSSTFQKYLFKVAADVRPRRIPAGADVSPRRIAVTADVSAYARASWRGFVGFLTQLSICTIAYSWFFLIRTPF